MLIRGSPPRDKGSCPLVDQDTVANSVTTRRVDPLKEFEHLALFNRESVGLLQQAPYSSNP